VLEHRHPVVDPGDEVDPLAVPATHPPQGRSRAVAAEGQSGRHHDRVSAGTGAISARYSGAALLKIATDTWVLSGNVGTVA
jgi:hypothetical protein